MKAICVRELGGAEVLRLEDMADPNPKEGEALVKLEAVGVNFIDVYFRTGLYKAAPPFIPGMEGAGVVAGLGAGVKEVRVGDRVAWPHGASCYAELAAIPATKLIPMPANLDFKKAAASMVQGITADYLVHGSFDLKAGQTALVHAAAGGVGLLLVQMAKRIGARVIGTVSTEEKAALARGAGADDVILYSREDFEPRVKELTKGTLCDVVYDSVGLTTFNKSLSCLRPRGTLVLYGQSSGPVPPFDLSQLNVKGSLFITRPSLTHYIATREELLQRAGRVLTAIQDGKLNVRIGREFPLAEAAAAHRDLEGRKTTGKVLLIP